MSYKPPFPWFGGKSRIASMVWARLGNVKNYVEPFFGGGACLFLRPGGAGLIETVNDADGFVANFWRSMKHDSDAVASHADNPVNECDLHARHLWLLGQRESLTDRLCGDPEFYDAKVAGWWVWGQCCWIGSGWCSGKGPWQSVDGVMTMRNTGQGVNRQRPHLGDTGQERSEFIKTYLAGFANRLRNVRVCCGDWARVCGPSVTFRHGMTGVFLDPPYADTASRTKGLYATDCEQVAHKAREWAIEQGKNPKMRIVLAGYEGEHDMPSDWHVDEWEAIGGYGLISQDAEQTGRANKKRERLWCSPACLMDAEVSHDQPLLEVCA